MLHQDYIVRMLTQLAAAIMRVVLKEDLDKTPVEAADLLEEAVGTAVAIDGDAFLSLAPDSIAQIMEVTGTDPRVTEYVARSIMLAGYYREEAGETELASLRREQALAIAKAYNLDLSGMEISFAEAKADAVHAVEEYAPES